MTRWWKSTVLSSTPVTSWITPAASTTAWQVTPAALLAARTLLRRLATRHRQAPPVATLEPLPARTPLAEPAVAPAAALAEPPAEPPAVLPAAPRVARLVALQVVPAQRLLEL